MSKILKSLKRKITVLAVAMIAIQPVLVGGMMMPLETQAAVTVANVANLTELQTALADTGIATINITADILAIPATLVVPVGHPVTINGGDHTVTFTGLESVVGNVDDGFMIQAPTTINNLIVDAGLVTPTAWVGTYAIQVYNTPATLNNVTAKNGNGGIIVNNSTTTLTGAINVSGNGFGGIESTGASASLDVAGATFTNASEAYGKPTIWEDGVTGTTVINYGAFTKITKGGQLQYYLTAGNSVDPAATLAAAKTAAISELATYKNSADYRDAEKATLAIAITNGDAAINGATDTAGVSAALASAEGVIDAIKTDAQLTAEETAVTLAAAKITAHGVLTTALATYTQGNYTVANWTTLTGFKTNGDIAIDAATDSAGVILAQNTATTGMASVQVKTSILVLSPVVTTVVPAVATVVVPETVPVDEQFGGDASSDQGEVKADTTIKADDQKPSDNNDQNTETKEKKNIPLWGIIFLLVLAGIGGYLFYSQNPEQSTTKGTKKK